MRLRASSIFCVLLTVVFIFSACAPFSPVDTDVQTLVIAASKSLKIEMDALAEGFNASQTKYVLKVDYYDNSNLLYYYFEHGAIDPDMVVFENINSANYYSDYLQSLNRFECTSQYQVSILNSLKTVEGNLFALPAPGTIYMQCFNADKFSAININDGEYPETLQDFSDGSIGMLSLAELLGSSYYSKGNVVAYTSEAGELSLVYTLMEVAVPLFASSTAGIDFLKKYYETDVTISNSAYKENWEEILTIYQNLYGYNYYSLDNESLASGDATQKFMDGNAYVYACVPGSDLEEAYRSAGQPFNIVLYPFVGETQNQKWIISKPDFYIGVSKRAYDNGSGSVSDGMTEFMEYFSSEEGRNVACNNNSESIRYTTDSQTNLTGMFKYLNDPINQNKIYLCDLFVTVFSSAIDVLRSFVSGQMSLSEAIESLDKAVSDASPGNVEEYVSESEFDYPDGGIVSETAIGDYTADVLRTAALAEAVIVPSDLIYCNIYKGNLDEKCLGVVFDSETSLIPVRITVFGIKQILEDCSQDGVFPLISGIRIDNSGGEITVSLSGIPLSDNETVMVLLTEQWQKKYSEYVVSSSYGISYTTLELVERYLTEVNSVLRASSLDGRYGSYRLAD